MPRRGSAGHWAPAAIGIAIAGVCVFLLAFAFRAGDVVEGIYRNSDYASTPVIAQLLGSKGSGDVTLGNYPWIESLYALRLTRWLPAHRDVWEVLPFAGYLATIAVFAWTLRRTISGRAALVGALALAAPAPLVMGLVGAPANRLPTLAHAVLLAAFLVSAPAFEPRPRWTRGMWAAALAVSLAPGVASDPLLLVWGVAPMLAALAAGWRLGLLAPGQARLAAAATAMGTLGGWALDALASAHGIHKASFPIHLVPLEDWPSNAWDALRSIAQFLHGEFVLDALGEPLALAESAMAFVAVATVALLLLAAITRARPLLTDIERPGTQRLLLAFSVTSLASVLAAVIVTDVAAGLSTVRYLLVAWPALLALALILWPRGALAPVALLAAACAVIGVVQLHRGHYDNQGLAPSDEEIAGIERFVSEQGLDHGYAGYWDAAPITYLSDFRALTYPVGVCTGGAGLCEFSLHTMDSWYEPKPGVRTFFVHDTRDIPVNPGPPPSRWGRPLAEAADGHLRLYAYAYDIASVLPAGTRHEPTERGGGGPP